MIRAFVWQISSRAHPSFVDKYLNMYKRELYYCTTLTISTAHEGYQVSSVYPSARMHKTMHHLDRLTMCGWQLSEWPSKAITITYYNLSYPWHIVDFFWRDFLGIFRDPQKKPREWEVKSVETPHSNGPNRLWKHIDQAHVSTLGMLPGYWRLPMSSLRN